MSISHKSHIYELSKNSLELGQKHFPIIQETLGVYSQHLQNKNKTKNPPHWRLRTVLAYRSNCLCVDCASGENAVL